MKSVIREKIGVACQAPGPRNGAGFFILLCILFLFSSPAQATCATFLCLNNVPGQVPAVCIPIRQQFFLVQMWTPTYNGPATSEARRLWLQGQCPTMDQSLLEKVLKKYGQLVVDPQT